MHIFRVDKERTSKTEWMQKILFQIKRQQRREGRERKKKTIFHRQLWWCGNLQWLFWILQSASHFKIPNNRSGFYVTYHRVLFSQPTSRDWLAQVSQWYWGNTHTGSSNRSCPKYNYVEKVFNHYFSSHAFSTLVPVSRMAGDDRIVSIWYIKFSFCFCAKRTTLFFIQCLSNAVSMWQFLGTFYAAAAMEKKIIPLNKCKIILCNNAHFTNASKRILLHAVVRWTQLLLPFSLHE